jgi:hypothetical protein
MFQILSLGVGSLEAIFTLLVQNPSVALRLDMSFKLFPIGVFASKAIM